MRIEEEGRKRKKPANENCFGSEFLREKKLKIEIERMKKIYNPERDIKKYNKNLKLLHTQLPIQIFENV